MARRLAPLCLLALLVATPAGADTIVDKKRSVDARIAALNQRVAEARTRERALQGEISSVSARIRSLEAEVGDVSRRLPPLEEELRLRRLRVSRLNALFETQTERLAFLRAQHRIALERLSRRAVELYESDQPDVLALVFSARSFDDLLNGIDYLRRVGSEDERIADFVGRATASVRAARARTRLVHARVRQEARVVSVRVAQARELRDRLAASRQGLESARAQRQQNLGLLTQSERAELGEIEALSRVSEELTAKIQAAQGGREGTFSTPPPAGGLIWPVSGPITSPFGERWGRMHEGIDVAGASGTPIRAAAGGTVIYASWMEGYGNLVVIDHGDSLATAYAHQSQLAVSVGAEVTQGQVIGYVGSTGHSTGPHLHFEVRVNGQPVDPLGYL